MPEEAQDVPKNVQKLRNLRIVWSQVSLRNASSLSVLGVSSETETFEDTPAEISYHSPSVRITCRNFVLKGPSELKETGVDV